MRYFKFTTTVVFILAVCAQPLLGQRKVQQKVPERTRILFLLDGSGSMMGIWHNGESRIDVAKRILTRLVDSLRSNEDLELALRVYGHRYSRQANNCEDTKLEVPFGTRNHDQIIAKLKDIVPKGVTPITYSLLQAATDFPISPGYRNILILITDGVESCQGDPCATSIELQRRGVFLRPFIIGLGLQGGKALECAGQYFDSGNSSSFNNVLNEAVQTTFATTSVSVELLDQDGNADETNVDVSFLNEMTGTPAYEFVHYLDASGRPDTVNVDPVNSYTVVVNTVPPVIRNNVNIVNGRHNVISIPVPQGNLVVKQDGRRAGFQVVVRTSDNARIINTQMANESFRYLAGRYRIETLTLPRRQFDVVIEPDKTRTIELPAPGLVNINTVSQGYGSVFEIMADGTEQWVCHLDPHRPQHSLTLLPGKYKVAFRVRDSGGSKYTGIKVFELSGGQTLNLSVFD